MSTHLSPSVSNFDGVHPNWFVYPAKAENAAAPLYEYTAESNDPRQYLPEPALSAAVNVAIALGQPLLVTGEPGAGKTQLAYSIAFHLGQKPLVFNTKTTTTGSDLFYRYDALRHFHDTQVRKTELELRNYVEFQALGLAIIRASSAEDRTRPYIPPELQGVPPRRSVVLIDEIDKAPRDVPNDVLNEIEDMSFKVKEASWKPFRADPAYRPIAILTSNSERNLPDAFLRRCVFYHLDFPKSDQLQRILLGRLSTNGANQKTRRIFDHAVEHFEELRELPLKKKPATAELIGWVRVLQKLELDPIEDAKTRTEELMLSYSVLAKNKEDFDGIRDHLAARS